MDCFPTLNGGVGSPLHARIQVSQEFVAEAVVIKQLVQRFILEYKGQPVETKQKRFIIPDRPLKIKFINRD